MEQMVPEVVLTVTKNNQDSVMKSLLVDHWNSKTNKDKQRYASWWVKWLIAKLQPPYVTCIIKRVMMINR
jgi:hypothetical protein